jgi:hypothetical protein
LNEAHVTLKERGVIHESATTEDWLRAKGSVVTFTKAMLALTFLMSGTLGAPEAKVTQLLSKDLTNLPGKEGTKPAKFVVFFVKDKGAPVLVPAK